MSSIQDIATEAAGWFEVAYRVDGDTDSAYVRTRDGRPDWLTDIIHDAHADMFPDDWRYAAIRSALEAIGEGSDEDDVHEWADSEVDVYNGARLEWLSSNLRRASYCDEAVDELGGDEHDTFERIGLGQYFEASEVFSLVLQGLEARADELDADETCAMCGGSGQRATALTANGRELARHEASGTKCDDCAGSGIRKDGDDA